jgi:hypothetical protein
MRGRWIEDQRWRTKGRGGVSFASKTRKKKWHGWSSPRKGGCSGVLAKSGEVSDVPATGGGWNVEGRLEVGIGARLGKSNRAR